jgi:CheY-like chemotaxis protein/two-component sensor histidine kinase
VLECLEKIGFAGEHLTEMVDSILDITRIEQGKEIIKETDFNIDDFVNELYILLEPIASKKHIVLDISSKEVVNREITADYSHILHIMTNLATNSIKYTASGGFVKINISEITCKQTGFTTYEFMCKDNGIGMSQEFIEHIYEPFTRDDSVRNKQIKGAGLGMSIVRKLIDLLEGDIHIKSMPGEGTEVTVRLDMKVSKEKVLKGNIAEYKLKQLEELKERKIVLIAEDEVDNREVLETYLKDMGYEVDSAINGEVVLDMFMESEEGFYKAIFMDIEMPVLNGHQATIMIRGLNRTDSNLPIVAMTANAFEEDRKKAAHSGMNHYVTKPLKMEQLTTLLNDIF